MNYLQESQIRRIPGPNGLGILAGIAVGAMGAVSPIFIVLGIGIGLYFALREVAESKSGFRRAETDVPALMEQIQGVDKAVFLQAPDVVRENMERALMTNIDKLEEIALGLEQEANVEIAGFRDPRAERKEQAAIKLGLLVKDLLEAHAKFTELTGRALPSRVLKAQSPQPPATPGDSPSV